MSGLHNRNNGLKKSFHILELLISRFGLIFALSLFPSSTITSQHPLLILGCCYHSKSFSGGKGWARIQSYLYYKCLHYKESLNSQKCFFILQGGSKYVEWLKEHTLSSDRSRVQILGLTPGSCMTLDKLLQMPLSHFPQRLCGDGKSTCLRSLF